MIIDKTEWWILLNANQCKRNETGQQLIWLCHFLKVIQMSRFKKSLELFGSFAAPTGWGYLNGGEFIAQFLIR